MEQYSQEINHGKRRRREGERESKTEQNKAKPNLSDSMPVNDNTLSGELVSEFNNNGVSGFCSDGGAGKLAIDPHHHILDAIGRPEQVLHFPFDVPALSTKRQSAKI
jgi:hypothetical protein